MNCAAVPLAIPGLAGVTAIDVSVAAVIANVVMSVFPVATSVAVIVVAPKVNAEANPVTGSILATAGVEEIQVTDNVFTTDVLSELIPIAVNCCVAPLAILGLTGVIARDESVAAVTSNVVEFVMPVAASRAEIVMGPPTVKAVATPLVPAALLILATAEIGGTVAHVTDAVRSSVERSEYIPVALNCSVVPLAIFRVTGVTTIDERVAAVTFKVVTSVFPVATSVAVIVVAPNVNAEANPVTGSMLATAGVEEIQVTDDVFTITVLSEFIPIAVNCCVVPLAILGLIGLTDRDASVAAVTSNVVEFVIPVAESIAVIVTGPPTASAVASPFVPAALLILATGVFSGDGDQVTDAVISCIERSE